jgi:hypothetical protein
MLTTISTSADDRYREKCFRKARIIGLIGFRILPVLFAAASFACDDASLAMMVP